MAAAVTEDVEADAKCPHRDTTVVVTALTAKALTAAILRATIREITADRRQDAAADKTVITLTIKAMTREAWNADRHRRGADAATVMTAAILRATIREAWNADRHQDAAADRIAKTDKKTTKVVMTAGHLRGMEMADKAADKAREVKMGFPGVAAKDAAACREVCAADKVDAVE